MKASGAGRCPNPRSKFAGPLLDPSTAIRWHPKPLQVSQGRKPSLLKQIFFSIGVRQEQHRQTPIDLQSLNALPIVQVTPIVGFDAVNLRGGKSWVVGIFNWSRRKKGTWIYHHVITIYIYTHMKQGPDKTYVISRMVGSVQIYIYI